MNVLEKFGQFFEALPSDEKEAILKYAYEHRPRPWLKTSRVFGYEDTGSTFDLDLLDGQSSERFPSGKYEFKKDFEVSDTGNIAVEVECSGKPSGLSTTEADWWVHWLSGEKYRTEVAVIIKPRRLLRIADTCWHERGGDNGAALSALVPVKKVLASDSEIRKYVKSQNPQISLF